MSLATGEMRALADAAFGALNSGDLDAFLALMAEDIEFVSMLAEVEGTTFRGHDGVRTWWKTIVLAFEDAHFDVLDAFAVPGVDDRGVAHFRLCGRLGGVPVEQTMWQAVKSRDGKVTWWAFARSEREALEAAWQRS
jgi:ketosteroid isomerase-like protein